MNLRNLESEFVDMAIRRKEKQINPFGKLSYTFRSTCRYYKLQLPDEWGYIVSWDMNYEHCTLYMGISTDKICFLMFIDIKDISIKMEKKTHDR